MNHHAPAFLKISPGSPPLQRPGEPPSSRGPRDAAGAGTTEEAPSRGCPGTEARCGNHSAKRVLIVDDEAAILFGFKRIIQGSGAEVDTAETVEEAMGLLGAKTYQFVITDLKLSGSSGEEGFEIIRCAREHAPDTKIILVTGYGAPEVMERALAEGASYYYEKPVSCSVLRDALKRLGL